MFEFDSLNYIVSEVAKLPRVRVKPSHFEGVEFTHGTSDLGRLHENGSLDLNFNKALAEQLVSESRAEPHPLYPNSGWITYAVNCQGDVYLALRLLKLAYYFKQIRLYGRGGQLSSETLEAMRCDLRSMGLSAAIQAHFEVAARGA
jgi:hypothetical protein